LSIFLPDRRRFDLAAGQRIVGTAFLCLLLAIPWRANGQQATEPPLTQVGARTLVERDLFVSQARPPAYRLQIEMAVMIGSRWTTDVIFDAVKRTATILAQCDVQITLARLHEYEGPRRYRYLSTPESREFARLAGLRKPAVFFVDDTLQRPAFDAEAIGRANAKTRPEMADTVWITAGIRDLPIALAHELVHVLANSGEHSDSPDNLMGDATTSSHSDLSPEQCRAITANGQANGLLDRIPAPGDRR
jgi:hypothetical protein